MDLRWKLVFLVLAKVPLAVKRAKDRAEKLQDAKSLTFADAATKYIAASAGHVGYVGKGSDGLWHAFVPDGEGGYRRLVKYQRSRDAGAELVRHSKGGNP